MGRSVGGIDLNSCFSQLFIRQNQPVLPHHRRPQRRRRRRRRGRRVLESAKPQLTSIPHSRANSWLELMTGSRSRTSPRHQTSMPLAFRTVVTKRALPSLPFSSIFFSSTFSLHVWKTCKFCLRYHFPSLFFYSKNFESGRGAVRGESSRKLSYT